MLLEGHRGGVVALRAKYRPRLGGRNWPAGCRSPGVGRPADGETDFGGVQICLGRG